MSGAITKGYSAQGETHRPVEETESPNTVLGTYKACLCDRRGTGYQRGLSKPTELYRRQWQNMNCIHCDAGV